MGRRLVYDIETDGYLDVLTKVHCIAIRDIDNGEVLSFADHRQTTKYPSNEEGLDILSKADLLIAHNGIGFDHTALEKVYPGYKTRADHFDTMVISRAVFTNLGDNDFKMWRRGKFPSNLLKKPHSLAAWGHRLGDPKDEFDGPWDSWTQTMHDYCIQDTSPCFGLYNVLQQRKVPQMLLETEHELAWYLRDQYRNGFMFNGGAAAELYSILLPKRLELEQALKARFKSWYVGGAVKTPKKTVRYKRPHLAEDVREIFTEGAAYTPLKRVDFNPSSRDHIAYVFQKRYGWQPQETTDSGKPKVDDDVIGALPYPEAKQVCEYMLLDKRIGALAEGKQAWMKLVTKDGFVHGSVNQTGTPTHRASHSNPNMTQVPKVGNPFGKECRSLFIVPEGWKLVGTDISGLELRVLSHYMARFDSGAYMKIVLEGDVHTENMKAGAPYLTTRDMAKIFIYAFIYGAGDWKLGHTCRPHASDDEKAKIGASLRKQFLKNIPALKEVVKLIDLRLQAKKPFILPTGHEVWPRTKHSALNYLIQSTGAIVCKRWLFHINRETKAMGLVSGWHGDYATNVWAHDETQTAVRDRDGLPQIYSKLTLDCIPRIQDELKLRCPLTGESKIGLNWADTH